MVVLRDYQLRAVSEIRAALGRHKSVVLCLPTGAGKTAIACEMIRRALARNYRCLFLAHRLELVEQARDRLASFGIAAGIIKAGFRETRDATVQVACVPSLIRRDFPPANLVIVDECHHGVSASFMAVIKHYRDADAWIVGLTGTAARLDGKPLAEAFDEIVAPVKTSELISAGFLIDPIVFAPPSISRKGLHKRGGDYSLPELAERMVKLTGSITATWLERAAGLKTVAFAVNVDHSQRIAAAFTELGIKAAHVDGSMSTAERSEVIRKLRAGDIDILSNCSLLGEGWDLPALQCAILARPTASLTVHRQQIGRVMRPPGPVIVLDHAGNHHCHGPVTDEIEWSLTGKAKRVPGPGIRVCPECFANLPAGTPVCPRCGAELSSADEVEPPGVENPGELTRFVAASREDKAEWYRDVLRDASRIGRALGWARHMFRSRFGSWPRLREIERSEYRCPGHVYTMKEYGPKRVDRCEHCYDERTPVSTAAGLT